MTKLTCLVFGLLVLSGMVLMVGAAPGARGTSSAGQDAMDIRALEQAIDMQALPKGDLDPAAYQ